MPESIVQVTEGTGKKLHTWQKVIGANTVEDEVVVLGDQYVASYVALTTGAVSFATALSHPMQIMAGASLKVYIRKVIVYQIGLATAASTGTITLTRLTTAGTGGTAVTPNPFESADGASGATAMTLPTVLGTLGVSMAIGQAYFHQTLPTFASGAEPMKIFERDFDRLRNKALVIPAGAANGIAVRLVNGISPATGLVEVHFTESAF